MVGTRRFPGTPRAQLFEEDSWSYGLVICSSSDRGDDNKANTNEMKSDVEETCKHPDTTDAVTWVTEQMRLLVCQLGWLVAMLSDVCDSTTCPVMCATADCQYLCAAHKQPQQCPALDYAIHTLDATMALLSNPKVFPSRMTVGQSAMKDLQSAARRIYRLCSHAYFNHRPLYDAFEDQYKATFRFHTLTRLYGLIPEDQLTVPLRQNSR